MSKPAKPARTVKDLWLLAWAEHGIGKIPEVELRFHDVRKFRFDFAWPDAMVAVETDGFGGGHQNKWALSNDHEKTNLAQECGWVVFRYTARCLGSKAKRLNAAKQVLRTIKRRRLERCTIQNSGINVTSAVSTSKGTK